MSENAHTMEDLKQMQSLPLSIKIRMTERRIRDWVNEYGEDGVYISFSGGKDSTVLLDIVRNRMGFHAIPAVFCDTGLEYPEIREFVKTFDNVTWLKPKMTFKQVIDKYGYPFISKETSGAVEETMTFFHKIQKRNGIKIDSKIDFLNEVYNKGTDFGYRNKLPVRTLQLIGKLPHKKKHEYTGEMSHMYNKEKWNIFLDAPFPITQKCCGIFKKEPFKQYEKETGRKSRIVATMAEESRARESQWIAFGCNVFDDKNPRSMPMSFWTEQDVLRYIKEFNIPICSVYGEIIPDMPEECDGQISVEDLGLMPDNRKLKTTGCNRTGCMFCGYGCHLEKDGDGRFEKMKRTHPKQYDYIMRPKEQGGLNYKEVIDWINEHGGTNIRY